MTGEWYLGTVCAILTVPERLIRIDDRTLRFAESQDEQVKRLRPGATVRYQTTADKKSVSAIEPKTISTPGQTPQPTAHPAPAPTVAAEKPDTPYWDRHEEYTVSVCTTVNLENYENIRVEFSGRVRSPDDIDLMIARMDETLARFGTDDATRSRIAAYRKRVLGGR